MLHVHVCVCICACMFIVSKYLTVFDWSAFYVDLTNSDLSACGMAFLTTSCAAALLQIKEGGKAVIGFFQSRSTGAYDSYNQVITIHCPSLPSFLPLSLSFCLLSLSLFLFLYRHAFVCMQIALSLRDDCKFFAIFKE